MDQICQNALYIGTNLYFERPCRPFGTGFKSRVVNPSPAYYRKITHKRRASLLVMFIRELTEFLNNNKTDFSHQLAKCVKSSSFGLKLSEMHV